MVHKSNSPPDLDKYFKGKLHNSVTYEDGARLYSMSKRAKYNKRVNVGKKYNITDIYLN